jgi:signal transduction histidine kinase
MQLARKLTLAILALVVAMLVLNAVERVYRDRRAIRDDIRRDHRSLGHALQVVVRESFREDGEQRALSLVEAANQRESTVQITWLWLPARGHARRLSERQRLTLARGDDAELVAPNGQVAWLYSYFPVLLHDGRFGAIEIGESLGPEGEIVRAAVLRTVFSSFALAVLAALLTSWLGVWLVGRPVAQLTEKARRVGAGDLSGPIQLSQRDELGDLAREMNAMCDRLQHTLEQLRHAERLATVGRLAAGIAHELGTPLNVVSIEAKRIAVGRAVGEAAQEGAAVITAQAERMTEIIRQLLDFAGRRTPRPVDLELGELAAQTLLLVGALAARHRITLRHAEKAKAYVHADAGQLQQVLTNLVVNAVQAMPAGGEVCVETGTHPRDVSCGAFMRVIDRGTGIAPDDLPRIFEPFFTTKEVGHGTGLGLAVAHGIVGEHGGRIDVENKPGEGATFTVCLPAIAEGT